MISQNGQGEWGVKAVRIFFGQKGGGSFFGDFMRTSFMNGSFLENTTLNLPLDEPMVEIFSQQRPLIKLSILCFQKLLGCE